MQLRGTASIGLVLGLVLAACGGNGAATQGPGGGGGTATQPPVATQSGGGGGGGSGGGGTGTVKYEVTGPVTRSNELPFFAFGSRFSGAAGVALNFTRDEDNGSGAIFTIGQVNGAHSISAIDEAYALSWAECETFEMNINGENATGRFDCQSGVGTNVADGSFVTGVRIVGTFEAHA